MKCLVQHSNTATQAVQAFMICKTRSCYILVCRQGATIHTINYKHTQKLISLLTSIMATVFESLPGKHLAVEKLIISVQVQTQSSYILSNRAVTPALWQKMYRSHTRIECHCRQSSQKHFQQRAVGWANRDLTPQVCKGGPLVVIDRKPKLWLLVLWNVGGAIALIYSCTDANWRQWRFARMTPIGVNGV